MPKNCCPYQSIEMDNRRKIKVTGAKVLFVLLLIQICGHLLIRRLSKQQISMKHGLSPVPMMKNERSCMKRKILTVKVKDIYADLADLMKILGNKNIDSLLLEGGSSLFVSVNCHLSPSKDMRHQADNRTDIDCRRMEV